MAKIAILFMLEDDSAIIGTDEGETGYMSEDLCSSNVNELKVMKAHDRFNKFIIPLSHDDYEHIELNKWIVPTPDGIYRVHCGYGKLSETWVIKGVAEKLPEDQDWGLGL